MNSFRIVKTDLPGLVVVESIEDVMRETWTTFNDELAPYIRHIDGTYCDYVQENESMSRRNVLRGIHMQINNPQGKVVWNRTIRSQ